MSEPGRGPQVRRLSKWGVGAALIYSGVGVHLIHDDYVSTAGGFINLKGLLTGLVTAPVAFPAELLHWPYEPLNPWHAGLALIACALLIYIFVAFFEGLLRGLRAPRS